MLGALFFWYHRAHIIHEKNITMTLSQNREAIDTLTQTRSPLKTLSSRINTVNFKTKYQLTHADLGTYDFRENFFVDLNTSMELRQDANCTFVLVSDDGYRVTVDGHELLADASNHDISVDQKSVLLTKGTHPLTLSYFQNTEITALRLYYAIEGERYLIGENSRFCTFALPKIQPGQKKKVEKQKKK